MSIVFFLLLSFSFNKFNDYSISKYPHTYNVYNAKNKDFIC